MRLCAVAPPLGLVNETHSTRPLNLSSQFPPSIDHISFSALPFNNRIAKQLHLKKKQSLRLQGRKNRRNSDGESLAIHEAFFRAKLLDPELPIDFLTKAQTPLTARMVQTRQKRGKETDKENADSPSKDPKPSSTQSQPAATPALAYADWASYQAYYNPAAGTNVATPGFPPQIASSPQGHPPYMWGPQMAPYGTPYVMYSHGGVYPYPPVQPGSVQYNPYPTQSPNGTTEASGKSNKSKSEKKLKGKKKSESSSNGTSSQSGESGSDDSSEGSSSSTNKAMSSGKEMSQKGSESGGRGRKKSSSSTPTSAPQQQQQMVVSPAMPPFWAIPPGGYATPGAASGTPADYWAAAAAAAAPATPITMTVKAPTPRRSLVQTDPNPQDEREQKRQKRKQSNRESARRSRLKKQAEWELVAKNAADLKQENESLKEELKRLQDECDKLNSENASLKEKVNESNHEL